MILLIKKVTIFFNISLYKNDKKIRFVIFACITCITFSVFNEIYHKLCFNYVRRKLLIYSLNINICNIKIFKHIVRIFKVLNIKH